MTVWVLAVCALGLFGFFSLFAMMSVDACSESTPCNYGFIYGAYGVGWIGAGTAALASLRAMNRAKMAGRQNWPWSLLGLAAIAACIVGFFVLFRVGLP